MSFHPFDRILSLAASDASDERLARAVSLKLDRRQALSALIAASGAALSGSAVRADEPKPSTLALGEEGSGQSQPGEFGAEALPTFRGRGIYLVGSRMGELWEGPSREKLNVLGPYVPSSEDDRRTDRAEELLPEENADPTIPPPEPRPSLTAPPDENAAPARPAGFLAWLTEGEAEDLRARPVVSGVRPYLPSLKVVAPAEVDARKAAVLLLGPNHWEKKPPAETFASPSEVADDLKRALAEVAADIAIGQTADALVVKHAGGEPIGDEIVRKLLAHPQVAAIQWETVATTLALGEEGGEKPGGDMPERPTTLALGEEAGPGEPIPSTRALGEEGGGVTTEALGEEGDATTFALGEEGSSSTTYALGEEGADVTTFALGEEGGTNTTFALGEEGGGVTTKALGEEGGPRPEPTTFRLGEEGGAVPEKPPISTRALGEEGGRPPSPRPNPTTLATGEEGGGGPRPIPRPPSPEPPRTTLALGEEGGGKRD